MTSQASDPPRPVTDWRTKLNDLAKQVPGLAGFLDREHLRDQDRVLREHTVARLGAVKEAVDRVKRTLASSGQIGVLDDFDHLTQRLDRLREKHRFAAQGYAPGLDPNKVGVDALERLYAYDLSVQESVNALPAKVDRLAASIRDQATALDVARAVGAEIDALAELIQNRDDAIGRLGR